MTTDSRSDRKKKSEKALALMSLAAERGKVRGSCLGDEEMAALVDGRSGEAALSEFLDHLGSCDRCYEEWLFLKKSMKQEAPRGRLHALGKLIKFRYIGTALAAAASVVVYLNVVRMEEKVVEQVVVPQTIQDKNIVILRPKPSATKEEKDESVKMAEQAPAALGSSAAKGRLEMKPAPQPRKSPENSPEEQQKRAAFAPAQVEKQTMGKAAEKPAAQALVESASAPVAAPPLDDIGGWLEELRVACLSGGRQDVLFWQDMAARGLRLQGLQTGPTTGRAEEKIVTMLTLVQEINGPDTLPQQCRLILAELAKEGGNR